MTVKEKIYGFINEITAIEEIQEPMTFAELGFDSLDRMRLIIELEIDFEQIVPDEWVNDTVGFLIERLTNASNNSGQN